MQERVATMPAERVGRHFRTVGENNLTQESMVHRRVATLRESSFKEEMLENRQAHVMLDKYTNKSLRMMRATKTVPSQPSQTEGRRVVPEEALTKDILDIETVDDFI